MGLFNLFDKKNKPAEANTNSADSSSKGTQLSNPTPQLSLEERYGKASLIGFKAKYWDEAILEFQKLEDAGLGEASIALGQLFQPVNPFEAMEHFKKAADMGLAEGAWGYAANITKLVEQKPEGNNIWYQYCLRAANGGCCDAMHELGKVYNRYNNYLSAFYWFTMSGYYEHPDGHFDATHLIKKWEMDGRPAVDTSKWNVQEEKVDGTSKLSDNALLLWEIYTGQKKISPGLLDTMLFTMAMPGSEIIGLFLGHFYEDHLKDDAKAKMAFQVAANSGSLAGMRCLGDMQAYGKGCERDLTKAFSWYRAAAKSREKMSCFIMANLYRKQPFLAAYWYTLSFRRGYEPALSFIHKIEPDDETSREIESAILRKNKTPFDDLSVGDTLEYVALVLHLSGGQPHKPILGSRKVIELGADYVKFTNEDGKEEEMTKSEYNDWYEEKHPRLK